MTINPSKLTNRAAGGLALKLEEVATSLAQQLGDPGPVLEVLVQSLSKGQPHPELWAKLHEAAQRDDKLAELAFAYEGLAQDRRVKLLPAEQQVEIFLHAVDFFRNTFNDPDGAISYAERALNVMPTHPDTVSSLIALLEAQGYYLRLARLYIELSASGSDRDAQLELLRKAVGCTIGQPGAMDLRAEIYERMLKVDPADVEARAALEELFISAGRPKDAAKLLEQTLLRDPPPSDEEAQPLRERLIQLYLGDAGEPQRTIPHVEALLARFPDHAMARQVAEALLDNKAISGRAAAALSDAYEKVGDVANAVAMLTHELKVVRGPRRVEVQRRLGILKQDHLGDPSGALELLAPVVAGDPGDDDLRRRFVQLSLMHDRPLDAARLLSRALQTAKDPLIRARVGTEIGNIYLHGADPKRALAAFQQVLEGGVDDASLLVAASRMIELYGDGAEPKTVAHALETVARLEPQKEPRHKAARRLAKLCEGELNDPARAITAYRALLDSPWVDEALGKLEAACEANNDSEGLVDVLEVRAERTRDPAEARELRWRAADLRTANTRDPARAILSWQRILEAYGPSRDVHERLMPLLEQERRWEEAAQLLEQAVALAPEGERAELLARLGVLRAARLSDQTGALQAFQQALALDPTERTARAAAEKLLASGDLRLEAATVLEPVYRREEPGLGLLRVLETRGELAPEAYARLEALSEAVRLAEHTLGNAERGLELAARGLHEAVASHRPGIGEWLALVQHFASELGDLAGRARHLASALGGLQVDSEEIWALAFATGEALAAAGEVNPAIEVYRRALAFTPASTELLARIDDLLAQQGDPSERFALYQNALAQQPEPGRRRELLHAIAGLQRRELGDIAQAIATWQHILSEDPKDIMAHQGLVEAFAEQNAWDAVYAELERMLVHLEGERRAGTLRRMAEVAAYRGDAQVALRHYRELLDSAELTDGVLETIELLARERGDADTVRIVLERRIARTTDPDEQSALYERLGDVQGSDLGDSESAVASWMQSARLAEASDKNDPRPRRLYERILDMAPQHREAAERLFDMYARAGEWDRIPGTFKVMLRGLGSDREPLNLLLDLEQQATAAGAYDAFAGLADAVLELDLDPARARLLLLAKARVLTKTPERHAEVDFIYRRLLEGSEGDLGPVADAYEQFLAGRAHDAARLESQRWLFAWRVQHAADPIVALLTWAYAEEQEFGDLATAARLYERVVERDPGQSAALTELSRLRASQGDADGALAALSALRELSEGEARIGVDLSIASLLLEQLNRPAEALDVVGPILDARPGDPDALRVVNRALSHPDSRARAAQILEHTASLADDPEAGARVLEALLEVSKDSSELAVSRERWFERLLEYRADDSEAAIGVALAAAEEFPSNQTAWDVAERAARRLNTPDPVAAAYARAIDRELSAEQAEALGRRLVEFHEEWFDDPERVVRLLERVLELSPGAGWAFDRLKLAFNAQGRWEELFQLYDRGLGFCSSDAERIELLREAAMAAKDFAGDAERAVGYLERLNQLSPGDSRVELSLERLYERHGRTRPLIDLLAARLDKVKEPERSTLELRIASLWLDAADPLPAFEIVSAMFKAERRDAAVIDLLERMVSTPQSKDTVLPVTEGKRGKKRSRTLTVREGAALLLIQHYEQIEQTADVVRLLEVSVETAETKQERARRLKQVARVRLERLGDVAGAFENVSALVALEPESSVHRAELAELARDESSSRRRAELLVNVATDQGDFELKVVLLREAAQVYQEELADEPRAIQLYLEVLDLDRTGDPALHAARQLDGLLDRAERAAERCDVLERLAPLETDLEARRRVLGSAARVAFEQLADPNRAVENWRARLELDDADFEAVDGLCAALTRAARWDELVNALSKRASLAPEPDAARADWIKIADIHAAERGDPVSAIEAWRVVRTRFGRDREGFEALSALLTGQERWDELCALIAEEASLEHDQSRRALLNQTLGAVHRDRTGDVLSALRAFISAEDWQRAIEVAGSETRDADLGRRVCAELLDLAVVRWNVDDPEAEAMRAADWAIEELTKRLLASGGHQQIVELLLRGSALPFPVRRRREFKRQAACICSDQIGDADRALALFRELFREDPSDDVAVSSVTRLTLLLEEKGLDEEVVALWEEQARCRERGGDVAAAAALWARSGERCEERLGDLERAIADYRSGAGLGGEASLEALARIYEGRGDHQRAAEVLEWLCAQSSRDALAERALRLANAYVAAGLRKRARARLEQAAALATDASAVRRKLGELYREASEWGPLADLLGGEADRATDPKTRLALLREAATLHVHKRREPNAAVPLLEQAISIDADDPTLRLALSDALLRAERYDESSQILRQQIERYGSRKPKDRALVHFQLARVSIAAGRRAEAITELDIATKIDPAHSGILQALARLAFEENQLDRAERMYRALLLVLGREQHADAPSRAEALLDLSEIAVGKDDPIRATEFVESAFEAALESPREAEALERALRQRGRHELLARALETRLASPLPPEQAARALADLAMLQAESPGGIESIRGQLEHRARSIQDALESAGIADDEAWSALGRVYDWLGDGEAESKVLERRVALRLQIAGDDSDPEPLYRLAEVRVGDTRKRQQALDLLQRALDIRPEYERAEQMLAPIIDEAEDERTLRLYERLARNIGGERRLAKILGKVAALPGTSAETVREGAALAKRLEDAALLELMLGAGLENAASYAPSDAAWVRRELADLREQQRDYQQALELREQAAAFEAPDAQRATLLSVARTAARELKDHARAARIYEALLAKEPADREIWEPLCDVYRSQGRKDDLVRLIDQTVPLVDAAADRSRLQLEQATLLLEQPDRLDEAADVLREILDEDPSRAEAAIQLSKIYEQRGRSRELVDLLALQLGTAKDREDVEAILSLSHRLGALLEAQDRTEEALDVYHGALEWSRGNTAVLEAVLRLSELRNDSFAAADAIEGLLKSERLSAPQHEPLLKRLVELRTEQHDQAGVQRALELGLRTLPGNAEIRERLIELYAVRSDWAAVAKALRVALEGAPGDERLLRRLCEAYRSAGQHELAASVLNELIGDGTTDAALYRERAALLAELGRYDDALADLERAYAADPSTVADYVAALENAMDRVDPSRRRAVALKLCDVLEATGDTRAALSRLAAFLEHDPQDRDALRRLAALEVAEGNWEAAAATYGRLLPLETGAELVDTALRLADACDQAGRGGDAREALERALEVAPDHPTLRGRLRDILIAVGANREVAEMLLQDAESAADAGDRLEYLLAAAEWLLAPEGDPARAISVLEQVRKLAPESLEGLVLLARAYAASGRSDEALRLLEQAAAAQRGRRLKQFAPIYQEMSRIQLDEGLLSDALDSLTKAFEMDLRNGPLAMELGRLALEVEEEEVATRAFRTVTMMRAWDPDAGEGASPEDKADAHYQLALSARKQGDSRKAKILVSKALSENPDHDHARQLQTELEAG